MTIETESTKVKCNSDVWPNRGLDAHDVYNRFGIFTAYKDMDAELQPQAS